MFAAFKYFQQSNNIGVFDLLKQINFLKYFPLAEIILHIRLLYGFDSYILPSELMNAQSYFTKSALTNQLHEFVVFKSGRWQFIVFLNIGFYELYQSVSFLKNGIIDLRHSIYVVAV